MEARKIKLAILSAEKQEKKNNTERTKTCKRCQAPQNLWSIPGAGKDTTGAVPSAAENRRCAHYDRTALWLDDFQYGGGSVVIR